MADDDFTAINKEGLLQNKNLNPNDFIYDSVTNSIRLAPIDLSNAKVANSERVGGMTVQEIIDVTTNNVLTTLNLTTKHDVFGKALFSAASLDASNRSFGFSNIGIASDITPSPISSFSATLPTPLLINEDSVKVTLVGEDEELLLGNGFVIDEEYPNSLKFFSTDEINKVNILNYLLDRDSLEGVKLKFSTDVNFRVYGEINHFNDQWELEKTFYKKLDDGIYEALNLSISEHIRLTDNYIKDGFSYNANTKELVITEGYSSICILIKDDNDKWHSLTLASVEKNVKLLNLEPITRLSPNINGLSSDYYSKEDAGRNVLLPHKPEGFDLNIKHQYRVVKTIFTNFYYGEYKLPIKNDNLLSDVKFNNSYISNVTTGIETKLIGNTKDLEEFYLDPLFLFKYGNSSNDSLTGVSIHMLLKNGSYNLLDKKDDLDCGYGVITSNEKLTINLESGKEYKFTVSDLTTNILEQNGNVSISASADKLNLLNLVSNSFVNLGPITKKAYGDFHLVDADKEFLPNYKGNRTNDGLPVNFSSYGFITKDYTFTVSSSATNKDSIYTDYLDIVIS